MNKNYTHFDPLTSQDTATQTLELKSFQELMTRPFQGNVNALFWNRPLTGDFSELVEKITVEENITVIEPEDLLALHLSEQGQLARALLLDDLKLLTEHGASPVLNLIKYYDRDEAHPFFPTDVYSWHVDRSPIPTSTFLCTYYGAPSELLPNSQAEQKILVPEIREELRKIFTGTEKEFELFLTEHFFDLHYRAKPGANIVTLGNGQIWRLAVDHPDSPVPPCVHRAPREKEGEPRLLLIC